MHFYKVQNWWSISNLITQDMFLQGVLPSHAFAPGRVMLQDKSGITAKG